MENKRILPVWANILIIVLCLGALALYLYDIYLINPDSILSITTVLIADILGIIIYCLSIIYCTNMFKKNSALYYILFCVFAAAFIGLNLYNVGPLTIFSSIYSIFFFLDLISFAIFSIFAVAKNLGKKKSLTMAIMYLVITVIETLVSIPLGLNAVLNSLTLVVVGVVFGIMVYAKYVEKGQRGAE